MKFKNQITEYNWLNEEGELFEEVFNNVTLEQTLRRDGRQVYIHNLSSNAALEMNMRHLEQGLLTNDITYTVKKKAHQRAPKHTKMTEKRKTELLAQLNVLAKKKEETKDFMEQMELQGDIHAIEMELNNIKPTDSSMDCEGCGS